DGFGIPPPRHDPDHDAENRKEPEIIDNFSDGLSDDLQALEKQLNTALMPPFSEGDLEADTKQKRRAFR
ncbi:hypothetical protein, partial [Tistrella sp.]|uniref:hypothetical protein n=1 Tax=Tistrella sp. TaxID=2024861 RepID=UPI0025D18F06